MQIKATINQHLFTVEWWLSKGQKIVYAGDVNDEEKETLIILLVGM